MSTPRAKAFQSSTDTIVKINIKMLIASGMAVFAYVAWPSSPQWWGFGLLCLYAGFMSIMLAIQAVKLMSKLYQRDKIIAEHMALGHQPKSSTLTNNDTLNNAGMR